MNNTAILTKVSFDTIGRMIVIEVTAYISGSNIDMMCGSSIDEIKERTTPFFQSIADIAGEKLGMNVELNEEFNNFITL